MAELHYLYGITWANCPRQRFGLGVDPRYCVELIPCGVLGALTSRVAWERPELAKLEQETADAAWLSQVALRHNRVLQQVIEFGPVLPLRLGSLFHTQASLLSTVVRRASAAALLLRDMGDRREWALKVYLDPSRVAEPSWESAARSAAAGTTHAGSRAGRPGGAGYLAARREQHEQRRQRRTLVQRELEAMAPRLEELAAGFLRLRPLAAALTHRPEKMVWNGAFLLSASQQRPFRTACEGFRARLAPRGLLLELSGPWPPYHFCPALDALSP